MNTIKFNHTLLIILALSSYTLLGQLKTQGNPNNALVGENTFLDASGNVEIGNHLGKGIGFPTTDLTQWEFVTRAADGINFPTTFDGLLVYNTGDGDTKADQGVVTPVEPGFYYFYNPNPAHGKDISKGKWLPVSKGGEAPAGGSLMSGSGAPSALTAPDPKAGDLYVDEETGDMYSRDDEKWIFHEETDDQKILKFAVEGTDLALSLEGDAVATRTIPLSDLGSVSSGAGAPAATAGSAGDVYVDENTGDLYTKDGDGWKKAGGGSSTTGTVDPTDPTDPTTNKAGDVYVNTDTDETFIYNGDTWVKVGGSADGDAWAVDGEDTTSAISRTGNVGIGTAATAARLTVDPSGANPTVTLGRTIGHPSIKSSNVLVLDAADGSRVDINNYHNGDVALAKGGGNVGVGTITPTQKLDVEGGARIRTLTAGTAADEVVVADATGVLKTVARTSLADGDAWGVAGEDVASTISRSGSVRVLGDTATEYIELNHGGSNAYLNWTGDGNLNFRYLGAHKMSLSQAGNLGIGTTADPTEKLDVNGGARIRTLTAGAAADEVVVADATGVLKTVARSSIGGSDGDAWGVSGEDKTSAISRTGNVGIGTAATAARLTVNPSGANPTVTLGRTGGQPSIKSSNVLVLDAADGSRVDINNYHNGDVALAKGGGNVGVGTITPLAKLDVRGGVRIKQLAQISNTEAGHDYGLVFENSGTNHKYYMGYAVGSHFSLGYHDAGANYNNLLTVRNNGSLGIGTTAPTQKLEVNGKIAANEFIGRSDKRYKKNIQPIAHALEKVTQMQGVYYHWNTDKFPEKDFSTDKTIGVIAQDIEKILPEVVTTDDTEEAYKAVNYAKLTAVLIEAIKEQQKQIEALQKEVHMLKH